MFNKVLLIFLLTFASIYCLYVIPERAVLTYVNEKFASNASFYVKRYSRKSPYYINLSGAIKHTWANNVSVHLIFYEFLNNEYKRTFVEFHLKACDLINSEPYIGGMFASKGIKCPLVGPNYYSAQNMTINGENFPNVWPFEKSRIEGSLNLTQTGETIGTGFVIASFKTKLPR